MSLTDRTRTTGTSPSGRPGGGPPEGLAARAARLGESTSQLLLPGARTALATWLLLALPALLAWVVSPLSSVTWLQALGVASAGWYLGHGLPVSVVTSGSASVSVGLAPLGLTAVLLLMTARSVRRLLDESEAAAGATHGSSQAATAWSDLVVRRLLPGYAAGYALVAAMAWLTTFAGSARPSVLAVPATLGVPLVAAAVCLTRRHLRDEPAPGVGPLLDRAPRWFVRALGPAVWGAALLAGASLAVVAVALLARLGTVTGLHTALDAGVVGGAVLVVGQALVVPDLAVWALSWLAGPGFSVGDGASVTLAGAHPGLLPLVPVLGALPSGGDFPPVLWGLLLVPVLVGAAVSWRAGRVLARLTSWRTQLETSAAACGLTAVVVLVAMLGASGSLGVQRLQHVGPNPWLATAAVLGELLLGAVAHLGVGRYLRRR